MLHHQYWIVSNLSLSYMLPMFVCGSALWKPETIMSSRLKKLDRLVRLKEDLLLSCHVHWEQSITTFGNFDMQPSSTATYEPVTWNTISYNECCRWIPENSHRRQGSGCWYSPRPQAEVNTCTQTLVEVRIFWYSPGTLIVTILSYEENQ